MKIAHICFDNNRRQCKISEKKYVNGYIGETYNGNKYVVIDRKNNDITIRFLETGYVTKVKGATLCEGKIKDKFKPSVCGVGYLGYCGEINRSKEYKLWKGIIDRCYNSKRQDYKMYGNLGVTVCERWKCFANFLDDIRCIDGYDEDKFLRGKIDLDKDIKQKDTPVNMKMYSLETCMFVDIHINRGITKRKASPPINVISTKGKYVLKTTCPVEELANKIGVKTQYITRILNKKAKTHNGWTFAYF